MTEEGSTQDSGDKGLRSVGRDSTLEATRQIPSPSRRPTAWRLGNDAADKTRLQLAHRRRFREPPHRCDVQHAANGISVHCGVTQVAVSRSIHRNRLRL